MIDEVSINKVREQPSSLNKNTAWRSWEWSAQ